MKQNGIELGRYCHDSQFRRDGKWKAQHNRQISEQN